MEHGSYPRREVCCSSKTSRGKEGPKDYLLYGKSSPHLQDGSMGGFSNSHDIPCFKTFRTSSHTHSSSKSGQGVHNHRKRKKDRTRFYNFFHEDHYVHPDNIFEANFGEHGFTWSQISWEVFASEIHHPYLDGLMNHRKRVSSESDDGSEDDTSETRTSIGSHAHRVILGLPPCGPLTLDDVKTAFRGSALRWHPDRHSGSSQAVAEENLKLCVNAYNSLCNVLKAA